MLITIPDIHLRQFSKRIATDIDPTLAYDIEPDVVTDEDGQTALEVTVSGPAGGAGVVSTDIDLPLVRGVPPVYIGVDWWEKPSVAAAANEIRRERDLMLVWPGATSSAPLVNMYNDSMQQNLTSGFINIGNWTATAIPVVPLPADMWTLIKMRYKFDYVAKTTTYLSISQGAQTDVFPSSLATFPAVMPPGNGWGYYPSTPIPGQTGSGPFSFLHLQIQKKLGTPGALTGRHRITLYASDGPIG